MEFGMGVERFGGGAVCVAGGVAEDEERDVGEKSIGVRGEGGLTAFRRCLGRGGEISIEGFFGWRRWNSSTAAVKRGSSVREEGDIQETCSAVPSNPSHSTKYSSLPESELLRELRKVAIR